MTLKEKFEQWFINDEEDEHYEGMVDLVSIEHEKIADEFAIGFNDWVNVNAYKYPTKTTTAKPAVKQTAASTAYQKTAQKATSVTSKVAQVKSLNDLPGVFQVWFDSLGLKGKPGVSQSAIISKVKDTLIKMGIK